MRNGGALILISRNLGFAVCELNFKQDIGISEHAFFERDDQELALREMHLNHLTNVLSVLKIQRSIDLVQNVQGCWLIFEQSQDEAKRQQRALTSR